MAQYAARPNEMKIVYDSEADVLYVTRGTPEYTDYVEHSEDVILRLDPDTKRLVGITIIDFSRYFEKANLSQSIKR
jgi:uncharacterized protein YuzE